VTVIEGGGTQASGRTSSVTQTSSPSSSAPLPARRRRRIGAAASWTQVRAAIGASTSPVATG
jgi:hypothetical protein